MEDERRFLRQNLLSSSAGAARNKKIDEINGRRIKLNKMI